MRRVIVVSLGALVGAVFMAPAANAGLLTRTYDTVVRPVVFEATFVSSEAGLMECTSSETPTSFTSNCSSTAGPATVSCDSTSTYELNRERSVESCTATAADTSAGCEREIDTQVVYTESSVECGTESVKVGEYNDTDGEGGNAGSWDYVEVNGERVTVESPAPPLP